MVVFKKRDSVPSERCFSVCNVLRQWRIWLIPTYRVYRLYDIKLYYFFLWWFNKKRLYIQELLDSPSVSESSKDFIIEDAGIDRSHIFDQSVECQASIEVGVQVRVSVRNVGTQVAPKSLENV